MRGSTMKKFLLYMVDAFTTEAFKGNPAAICLARQPLEDTLMKNIASEMNLSETAFPVPKNADDFEDASVFSLRWFTPETEVPLCGHGTLATAHTIFQELNNKHKHITFQTVSGDLIVSKYKDQYQMDFPLGKPQEIELRENLLATLNLKRKESKKLLYCKKTNKFLLEIESVAKLAELSPDFTHLKQINNPTAVQGLIVTAKDPSTDFDFHSRYFAPWVGINEDPVTGSAHVVLGPYWADKLEKNSLKAFQASNRTGVLLLQVKKERVYITGAAVTILKGHLQINITS